MSSNQTLLEKYIPKTWDEIKLPIKIRTLLTEMQQQNAYRLMMYGSAGLGKTSTAKLMVADKTKYQVLYLSGSNNFTIETYREKIATFCSGYSVNQKRKVVIIDECENIRDNLQDAFKILLDQSNQVSFIFITNEIEKVNAAIRSRCTQIEYNFVGPELEEQKKNFVKFVIDICKAECIPYENPGIKMLYNKIFPDFRHALVFLQQIKDAGLTLNTETILNFSESGKRNTDLYELIESKILSSKEFYEKATIFKGKERECFVSLGEPFFEYLNETGRYDLTLKVAIIVSKYSEQFVTSINKFVTLISCMIELRSIF